jgi:hypothetical protein
MFDHWFPAFSPSGRLAVGSQQITVFDNGNFANPQVIGPGLRPTWDGEALYYLRPDGVPVSATTGAPVSGTAFNEFAIHNGFWAGHRTDPPRIIWQRGNDSVGWWKPRLGGSSFSALRHADGALCFGNSNNIVDTGVSEHQLVGNLLVWVKGTEIFGRQGATGTTVKLTIPGEKHFYAVPLLIEGKPWVLTHTDNRLLLYPWGEIHGYVLNSGISDNPAAFVQGELVTAVWSRAGEGFGHKRRISEPRVDLRPMSVDPVEDTSGQPIDLWEYFIPLPGAFPRTSLLDGHGHEMHCIFDGRNFWTLPFGEPDHWVRMVIEKDTLTFREDRSRDGQSTGDYAFSKGLWAFRHMRPGDRISNPDNELVRYRPDTCQIVDRHPFPFRTGLWKRWTQFDCGGDLGVRDVIAYLYDPGGAQDTYELSYFAKGFGFFRWEEYDQRTDTRRHWTVFNMFGGRAPQPTPGCWRPEHTKPPTNEMTDAEVRALLKFTIPQDIYLGALDQFIANLIPRDRLVNVVPEDPSGPTESHTMTRGAQMFFNPLYYAGVAAWIGDRKRHPNGGAEWGDASMRGLINAVTEYNKLKDPVIVPPPPGDRVLRPFQGQVRLSNGFVDHAGYVKPVGCHLGDLLSIAARNWGRFIELLDFCVAAGYPYIRFWTTLGGDSNFWAGRGVGPQETPDYWGLLERVLYEFKARNMQAHIAQGDLRASVVPDRRNFAQNLADVLGRVGPDVCFLWEGLNECRDTGEPDARRLAEFAQEFRNRRPEPLITLSAYTGHEDVAITNDFSRAPADIFCVHGSRAGRWWDKIRHKFSFVYESNPHLDFGIEGEWGGPGHDVSAIDNKHELDDDVISLAAIMCLMTRQAFNFMSGPGVRTDANSDRLEHMPGFWAVPRAVALLPDNITTYRHLRHGGETWRRERVFAAQGEVRADHAFDDAGNFACLIYGPGSLDVPQTRNATITLDHRFGDKGRLVLGQAH